MYKNTEDCVFSMVESYALTAQIVTPGNPKIKKIVLAVHKLVHIVKIDKIAKNVRENRPL